MAFVSVSIVRCSGVFYAIAFRKKLYASMEEMQQDIDRWLRFYNNERAHSGRYCYGKTPMQIFEDSEGLAKEKDVNNLFGQSSTFKLPVKRNQALQRCNLPGLIGWMEMKKRLCNIPPLLSQIIFIQMPKKTESVTLSLGDYTLYGPDFLIILLAPITITRQVVCAGRIFITNYHYAICWRMSKVLVSFHYQQLPVHCGRVAITEFQMVLHLVYSR